MIDLGNYGTHEESSHPGLWRDVVGAWAPCLGPTGLRLHDFSRNRNWGSLTNMDVAADWVVDDGKCALDFDGSDDTVVCGQTNILGNAEVSVSFWFRPTNSGRATFGFGNAVSVSGGAFGCFYGLRGDQTLSVECGNNTQAFSSDTVAPIGVWSHVVAQKTPGPMNSTSQIAVNGTLFQANSGSSQTPNIISGNLIIGMFANFGASHVAGLLDDLQLRRRVLSAEECHSLYMLGRGGIYRRRKLHCPYRHTAMMPFRNRFLNYRHGL